MSRGPVWRCEDRVQISVASSKALYVSLVFPTPISSIVWSLLSFVLLTSYRHGRDHACAVGTVKSS